MSDQNQIIPEAVAASTNRRSLLKKIAAAGVALQATQGGLRAQTPSPADVAQFALNLEYLEAEFYSIATTGRKLSERGVPIDGAGTPGPTTTAYGQVFFSNNAVLSEKSANDTADDEIAHVKVLRGALQANGVTPIAKPAINLDALAGLGASLANQQAFIVLARAFEDIGVSAYAGGAALLAGSPYLMTAARIAAVEGEHAGNIRLAMAKLGIGSPKLDAADVLPPPTGTNVYSTNKANGLCAFRTPGQVLYLAYGFQPNVEAGGFFPNGVNGMIRASTFPATAANLS